MNIRHIINIFFLSLVLTSTMAECFYHCDYTNMELVGEQESEKENDEKDQIDKENEKYVNGLGISDKNTGLSSYVSFLYSDVVSRDHIIRQLIPPEKL